MGILTALHEATARVRALDFTTENERIADIDHQIAQVKHARETAAARRDEISQILQSLTGEDRIARPPIPEGSAVADALLAGGDVTEAAAAKIDVAALRRERTALHEGISDLGRRESTLERERRDVQSEAGRRMLKELQPLCSALEAKAREAAAVIVDVFASMEAIGHTTSKNPPSLQNVAAAARVINGELTPFREYVDVSAEVVDLLSGLADKGPVCSRHAPRTALLYDRFAYLAKAKGMLAAARGQP